MIFTDTETTGLIQPKAISLDLQPEIVEVAAIKTDDELNEIARLEFMCKPSKPISDEVSRINGITNAMLEDKKPFVAHFKELSEFFLGEVKLVAHNAAYDVGMISLELQRLKMECKFPWPMIHECTVQIAAEVGGHKSKSLGNLHQHYFGEPIKGAHRAMNDVEAMIKIYREMRNAISSKKAG